MFSPHKAFPPALQNFAEAGISRDNVAEAHPRENFREAEAGITRDNVAEAVGLGSVLSTQSGWSKWRG